MILKTSDEINNWLSGKNFFEWTTLKAKLVSNTDLKIIINFDDIKDKVAGEKYNHWDVEILIRNCKEVYRLFNNWDFEKQQNVIVKKVLDIVEYVEKINNSRQISIKPEEDIYGIYFDDWMSEVSCVIEGEGIEILLDVCKEQVLTPKLSNQYISFTYLNENFPSSKFWIDELENEGVQCSFIEYFLNPVDINKVPDYDYDKWSIRPSIEKGEFPFGINVCNIERNELTRRLTFELQEDKLVDFFEKVKIVATKKPLVQVKCGNVIFTDSEWRQYLETKEILS